MTSRNLRGSLEDPTFNTTFLAHGTIIREDQDYVKQIRVANLNCIIWKINKLRRKIETTAGCSGRKCCEHTFSSWRHCTTKGHECSMKGRKRRRSWQCSDILHRAAHLPARSRTSCELSRYPQRPDVEHGSTWRGKKEHLRNWSVGEGSRCIKQLFWQQPPPSVIN